MVLALSLALGYCAVSRAADGLKDGTALAQPGERGALFVMTDSADSIRGNEVVMYDRDRNGDLRQIGYFATGRNGAPQLGSGPAPTSTVLGVPLPLTADGLGSSDSLVLALGNHCLFAVNAGSNTLSSFRVRADGLELADVVSSQGDSSARFPASLAVSGDLLYALNAGDQGSLVGFHIGGSCTLQPLDGATRELQGVADTRLTPEPGDVFTTPGHASFSPDGKRLVVAVKGGPDGLGFFPSGRLAVFPVNSSGRLGAPVVTPSSFVQGTGGPFSLVFLGSDTLAVAHANSSTVASYRINPDNTLSLHSDVFTTGDVAPCWLDRAGNFLYTASFGGVPLSGSAPDADGVLDGFRINADGTLAPLGVSQRYPSPGAGRSGNHGVDIRVVGKYLYFLQPRVGAIGRYTIGNDGSLTNLANFGGLPAGAEPFAGLNPGINDFAEACFLQDPLISPECRQGSPQGIAAF